MVAGVSLEEQNKKKLRERGREREREMIRVALIALILLYLIACVWLPVGSKHLEHSDLASSRFCFCM